MIDPFIKIVLIVALGAVTLTVIYLFHGLQEKLE